MAQHVIVPMTNILWIIESIFLSVLVKEKFGLSGACQAWLAQTFYTNFIPFSYSSVEATDGRHNGIGLRNTQ